MAEWHDTTEEYLEAILEIEEEGTIPIRARLVERLGLSAPAVSETVNRLVDHGYAELLDDRSLRLTAKGREVATSIVRRIREQVEIDEDAINFLATAELVPGSNAVVVSTNPDGVQVTSAAGEQTVPRKLAQLIYAIPA